LRGSGQEEGGRREFRDIYLDSESEENNIYRIMDGRIPILAFVSLGMV
jgi:hypothetical protein